MRNILDWDRYLHDYKDLIKNGIRTHYHAKTHWEEHGIKEKRKLYYFGNKNISFEDYDKYVFYLKNSPKRNLDSAKYTNIIEKITKKKYYNIMEYLNDNPDIKKKFNINNGFVHWINHGRFEKRIIYIKIIRNIIYDKVKTIHDFRCINILNIKSYEELMNNSNGDNINESNFIKNIQEQNITLYFNNKFIFGNKNLKPEITISRNINYNNIPIENNIYLSSILHKGKSKGIYVITKSMIEAIRNINSLLYPHVYNLSFFDKINKKKIFLQEQKVNKEWYNWLPDNDVDKLKLKYFPKDSFIICICGRIAINNYPKSLLESIKILRNQKYDIQLLVLGKLEVRPERLTQKLYNEITSYKWVKSFTFDKKDILNYFRMCDILASTYRDYCNHVGGSNKIKEYLLCNKPILCSRGKEREREFGKNYSGFYECKTCDSVPPLCWTKEYLKDPNCYIKQSNKYFENIDISNEIYQITNYIKVHHFLRLMNIKNLNVKININLNEDIKEELFTNNLIKNNIVQQEKYDNCNLIFTNDIKIIKKAANNGKIVFTSKSYEYPNTVFIDKDVDLLKLITYDLNTENYKKYIKNNVNLFLENKKRTNTVVYIPVWKRHKLLIECINSIKNQTEKCIIIGICSNKLDYNFVKNQEIIPIATLNRPLGFKYQNGLEISKIFYPKNVIIMGSDDTMTNNYIENFNKYTDKYDVISINYWKMSDISKNKNYSIKYNHKIIQGYWGGPKGKYKRFFNCNELGYKNNIFKKNPFSIGSGRSIGYRALNKINWKLYMGFNVSLDSFSLFKLLIVNKCPHITLGKENFYITSLKDSSEDMINTMENIFKADNLEVIED
jgi:hypothetical protein